MHYSHLFGISSAGSGVCPNVLRLTPGLRCVSYPNCRRIIAPTVRPLHRHCCDASRCPAHGWEAIKYSRNSRVPCASSAHWMHSSGFTSTPAPAAAKALSGTQHTSTSVSIASPRAALGTKPSQVQEGDSSTRRRTRRSPPALRRASERTFPEYILGKQQIQHRTVVQRTFSTLESGTMSRDARLQRHA